MFRSHFTGSIPVRPRNTWSLFGFAHIRSHESSKTQTGNDARPLWQRLDDEEDQQLIRQQKLTRGYRVAALVAIGIGLLLWFVAH